MFGVQELREDLCLSLRSCVASGEPVLPVGFTLHTRCPSTLVPDIGVTTVYGKSLTLDIDVLAHIVRKMAIRGRAKAAGISLVSSRDNLPAEKLFEVTTDDVAVLYIDSLQGSYEVWVAPVVGTDVGTFTQVSSLVTTPELPHVLPLALYGSIVGEA